MRHAFKVPCLLSGNKRGIFSTTYSRSQAVSRCRRRRRSQRSSRFQTVKGLERKERTPLRRSHTIYERARVRRGAATCDDEHVGAKRKESNTAVASSASIDWSLISSHNANHSWRYKLRDHVLHVLCRAA